MMQKLFLAVAALFILPGNAWSEVFFGDLALETLSATEVAPLIAAPLGAVAPTAIETPLVASDVEVFIVDGFVPPIETLSAFSLTASQDVADIVASVVFVETTLEAAAVSEASPFEEVFTPIETAADIPSTPLPAAGFLFLGIVIGGAGLRAARII